MVARGWLPKWLLACHPGRRLTILAILASLAPVAWGQQTTWPRIPGRSGYAFDWPGILAQQRIFGLAHGIGLLARACAARNDEAAIAAYGKWQDAQKDVVERARGELAVYIFGSEEVADSMVAEALHLKPMLGSAEMNVLTAACASLPDVLDKPRYDLGLFLRLQRSLTQLGAAAAVKAQGDSCLASSSPDVFAKLSQNLEDWHRRFDEELAQARADLMQRWQDTGVETSFDSWLEGQVKRGRKAERDCAKFSEWLATERAAPDYNFIRRP